MSKVLKEISSMDNHTACREGVFICTFFITNYPGIARRFSIDYRMRTKPVHIPLITVHQRNTMTRAGLIPNVASMTNFNFSLPRSAHPAHLV